MTPHRIIVTTCKLCGTDGLARWFGSRPDGGKLVHMFACLRCTLKHWRHGPQWQRDVIAAFEDATPFDEAAVDRLLAPILAALEA